jgi:hypothetical protein
MVPVAEGASVFISRQPLTVGQYLVYLEGTKQPVPDRYEGIKLRSAAAGKPVAGLSRKESERCATWHLKRLPTADEWQRAAATVGPRPYPWADDGTPVAAEAEVLLMQDWTAGSAAEKTAREAKNALPESILQERVREAAELRRQLEEMVARRKARREGQWKQLKPRFFALLEKEKRVVELQTSREGRADELAILTDLAMAKGGLAARLKTADVTAEETERETQKYADRLAEVRSTVQEKREGLQKGAQALQEQVLELTTAFENEGAAEAGRGLDEAEAVLKQTADAVKDATEAAARTDTLREAIRQLSAGAPAFEGVPSLEEIESRATALDEQIQQLSGEDPAVASIKDVREKIAAFSTPIGRDFVDEEFLVQELDDLVAQRARKKAVEAMLKGLKSARDLEPAGGVE